MEGKSVVIMGASSGLGRALAKLLFQKGAKLFLLSRTIDKADLSFESVKIQCDVTNKNSIKDAFKKIDKIDYLIYCVGKGLMKDLRDVSEEEIEEVLNTCLKGAIFVNQEAYKKMAKAKSGHIINIISTSGRKARAMETVYCAAKWGLRGFNDSLSLAAEENGIKVTGVYPGGMKSENFWKIVPGKDISAYMEPSFVAQKIIEMLEKEPATKELLIERPKT